MAIEIVRLTPELMPALRRFAERVWQRPRSEAYYRWRYGASAAFHPVWLALRDGECLAMEVAIRRPWRVGDQVQDILEVFDWYCLPELRNSGLGVRVMHALMKEPEPLLLVGGSEDTQGLLPRLKWQVLDRTHRLTLPLAAGRLSEALVRRRRVPPAVAGAVARAALARPGHRPRPRRVPRGGRVVAVASVGDEVLDLYRRPGHYGTVPMWTPTLLDWLTHGFPSVGHFVPLCFERGGALVGFGLLRVYVAAQGCDAEIVECFAPEPDVDLYTWMVSEIATRAAAFGPGALGTQSTCPLLREALTRNHFVKTGENPVQLWWPGRVGLPTPLAVGASTNDNPLVPWAERWWGDPPPR